jgi:phage protein D
MAEETQNTTVPVKVKIKEDIPDDKLHSFVVDQDCDQPDMAAVTLLNDNHEFTDKPGLGDEVEIKVGAGDAAKVIFKGEVVAIEGNYKTGGESRLVVRAFNKLHRLLRGKKSRTYTNQKDSQIASQIATDNGLSADAEDTGVQHEHVYQHNQTDLEFLRVRAARVGFEVLVDDRTLHFRKPKTSEDSGLELKLQDPAAAILLKSFQPRLSSAQIVNKVEVRGWNPEKKEVIVGTAEASNSQLGQTTGPSASSSPFGSVVTFTVDHPVASVDEANKLAEARLGEMMMGYITGEGVTVGNAGLKAGIVVKVTVNTDKTDDRFNGKYFLEGCTHRYRHSPEGGGTEGGYVSLIRFRRDAEKGQ